MVLMELNDDYILGGRRIKKPDRVITLDIVALTDTIKNCKGKTYSIKMTAI